MTAGMLFAARRYHRRRWRCPTANTMSIYHARRKQPGAAKQPDPNSSTADAIELDAPASDPAPAPSMTWLRKARPADFMLPATIKWFEALPQEVRPVGLAERYARI